MKLLSTEKRKTANKANQKLAVSAWKLKCQTVREQKQKEYLSNLSCCNYCNTILPFTKRRNKFCSQSCSASNSNIVSPKKESCKTYKPCGYCGVATTSVKYCSTECSAAGSKFRTDEEIRAKKNEISANYRAKLRNQTPPDADRKAITEFYKNCPVGHEVDHIIPISKGGLHTLNNLQYLTASENRKKSNKI
jgi:5-methylcytosine-specific restriction endonuclease McrA